MGPYRNLKRAFKGALKCKFEMRFSLVNLRGESGAQEAPYVALLTRGPGESPGGVDP